MRENNYDPYRLNCLHLKIKKKIKKIEKNEKIWALGKTHYEVGKAEPTVSKQEFKKYSNFLSSANKLKTAF